MNTTPNAWRIVAVREITVKLRDRSFIFSTLLTLVIIAASLLVPYWMNKDDVTNIAVLDDRSTEMVEVANPSGDEPVYTAQQFSDRASAEAAVKDGDADALLLATDTGWDIVFEKTPDATISAELTQAITSTVTAQNAAHQGIDLAALTAGTRVNTSLLNADDNAMMAMLVGMIFAFMFYMASFVFGTVISMSVVEEKQNRIVEIIATAIPTTQLLAGKIIGNIVLAVGQILVYGIVGLGTAQALGMMNEMGWLLSSTGWFIAFYIVGFAALATVWAAIGAMASRTEDISTLASPLTMVLVAAFLAGLYAKGTLATVLSFVPVVSSIAMPMRLMTDDVALWEPILALVLGIVAVYLLTRTGARIYTNNIMRSGSAVTWKQALKK